MPFTFTMPKLSPTMEVGTIVKWHKKVGEKVEADELLMEVSTDKATVEYNALDAGFLRKIIVEEGKEAEVNQPVAIFTETADEPIEGTATTPADKAPETKPADVPKQEEQKPQADVKAEPKKEVVSSLGRLAVSPLAKKLATQQGIDLAKIKGTGPGGRIVSRDLSQKASTTPTKVTAPLQPGEEALSPIRKIIATRLQEAKATIPHFYITQEIDIEPLVEFREQLSHFEHKVSFNDLMIKAVALALKDHPQINSGFNAKNQTILRYSSIDISVAVQVDSGLITPIVFNADKKPIEEISQDMRGLVKKAKEGKLQPAEFQGGSFTISNLGMFGVTSFTAIINPPQSSILAVGGIIDKPVVKHGHIVPGKTMTMTLSVDHRVVDGVAGAQFIKTLQRILENPAVLNILE